LPAVAPVSVDTRDLGIQTDIALNDHIILEPSDIADLAISALALAHLSAVRGSLADLDAKFGDLFLRERTEQAIDDRNAAGDVGDYHCLLAADGVGEEVPALLPLAHRVTLNLLNLFLAAELLEFSEMHDYPTDFIDSILLTDEPPHREGIDEDDLVLEHPLLARHRRRLVFFSVLAPFCAEPTTILFVEALDAITDWYLAEHVPRSDAPLLVDTAAWDDSGVLPILDVVIRFTFEADLFDWRLDDIRGQRSGALAQSSLCSRADGGSLLHRAA